MSKGINPIARSKNGQRRPAILIRSSPWKAGTAETPWHDVFDLDNGRVRYFGDHRVDHTVPVGTTQGNAVLLEAYAEHRAATPEQRIRAAPLLVFAAVSRNKTPKGYVQFCGLAVIERAELIEQEANGKPFPNYRYDMTLLDLSADNERVEWAWIEHRGNPRGASADSASGAPYSWIEWVGHGHGALSDLRRRTPFPAENDKSSPQRLTEGGRKSLGLLPAPRRPNGTAPASSDPTGSREKLTASMLMDRLRHLRVHQRNDQPSRHKPLALLWAISRIATGRPRLAPWPQFRDEVGELLAEFGLPDSSVTPEYPFWHLQTSRLWDVQGLPSELSTKPHASTFDRLNPAAGLSEQVMRLLDDPFVRSQAVAVLRETHLADVPHHALMERLGLAGYESASGVTDDGAEPETEPGPASRRTVTLSRLVRDSELTVTVKRLHRDRCQVCSLQLSTRFSSYSEAAHIRGLGRPHNGPDKLSNLLVLCPNHHVQFDTLAIYIDNGDTVRMTTDNTPIGQLRRHPAHQINEAHLRYHRALCGRDDG
ncbi:HNH endonuclease [Streptomyces sp. CdTB01]|uniref:HNH endonuclease n=1 Tax=Streptomyces sp. CdTB01 TaxID=1725411 RepID=UPI00131F27E5|nr:HNH endonuclease [Streptomyces sp. CdTB01]